MAAVQIRIDQAGASAGVPGQAREDLALGTPVQLTAIGGPYLEYRWSVPYKGIDLVGATRSSAALSASSASSTQLSPIDVQDTYLIALAVDSGSGLGALPEDNARITFYAGDALNADPTGYPRRPIATGETTEHNVPDAIDPGGNTDGWAREERRKELAAQAGGGGGFTAGNDLLGTSTSQTVQGISAPLITPDVSFAHDTFSASITGPGSTNVSGAGGFFRLWGGKAGPADASNPGGGGGITQFTAGAGGDSSATHVAGPGGKTQLTGGNGGLPQSGIPGATGNVGGDVEVDGGQASTSSSATSADHGQIRLGKNLKNGIVSDTQRVDTKVEVTFASTTAVDMNKGSFQHEVITNNLTINLTNVKEGGFLVLMLEQGGAGSITVTWGAAFNFGATGAPTLSTVVGKVDRIAGQVFGGKLCVYSFAKGF